MSYGQLSLGAPPSVPMKQPKALFRYGEQSIWSTHMFASAAIADSNNRLFVTPQGGVGQGFTRQLTIGETNLKEGGRVPNGVAYDVFGVSAHVMATSADNDNAGSDWDVPINSAAQVENLVNVLNNGVLAWDFTQTQVDIAPMNLCGAGGGVFGGIGTVGAGALRTSGHMGNGAGSIWMYRKHPVALPGSTTFAIVLRFGNRAAAIDTSQIGVKVTLIGYYKNIIEIG